MDIQDQRTELGEPVGREQMTIMASVLLIAGLLLVAVMWSGLHSNSAKCQAIHDDADRQICMDALNDRSAQPAKGANAPVIPGAADVKSD